MTPSQGDQSSSRWERINHKRMQDRRHQRARRQRMKEQRNTNRDTGCHEKSFQVHRWRLDEWQPVSPADVPPSAPEASNYADDYGRQSHHPHVLPSHIPKSSCQETLALSIVRQKSSDTPLPVDHVLLHLVKHNAGRGLTFNKSMLRSLATFCDAGQPLVVPDTWSPCEVGVVRWTHSTMPLCLQPTSLQIQFPHPAWIDIIPFPEMRDNLIRQQQSFNHIHFLEDIIGDLVHIMSSDLPRKRRLAMTDGSSCELSTLHQADPERKGLVLWGEPYQKDNWEAAPGFLKKWAWAVRGCNELLVASNRWRRVRGEADLPMVF